MGILYKKRYHGKGIHLPSKAWVNMVNRFMDTFQLRTWGRSDAQVDRPNPNGDGWVGYVPTAVPPNVYKKQWDLYWTDSTHTQFYLADYSGGSGSQIPVFVQDWADVFEGPHPLYGGVTFSPGPFTFVSEGGGLPDRYVSPVAGSGWWPHGYYGSALVSIHWTWDSTGTSSPAVELVLNSITPTSFMEVEGFDVLWRIDMTSETAANPARVFDLRGTTRAYCAQGMWHSKMAKLAYTEANHTGFQPS